MKEFYNVCRFITMILCLIICLIAPYIKNDTLLYFLMGVSVGSCILCIFCNVKWNRLINEEFSLRKEIAENEKKREIEENKKRLEKPFIVEMKELKEEMTKANMDEYEIDIFKRKLKDGFQATRFKSGTFVTIVFYDTDDIHLATDTITMPEQYKDFTKKWLKDNGFYVLEDLAVNTNREILKVTID